MKPTFLLFALLFSTATFAQDLAGRKIINGNVNMQLMDNEVYGNTNYSLSLLAGKIKPNLSYLAWGASFAGNHSKNVDQKTAYFSVGPAVEYGKFIPLVDRFYLAPTVGGTVTGTFGDAEGFGARVYATPLRFMYHFGQNFMLTGSFGAASANYSKLGKITNANINASLNNQTSFGVYYTFKK
jgi:hypothetical protein